MKYSTLSFCIFAALYGATADAAAPDTSSDTIEKIEVLGHKLTTQNHDVAASVSALTKEQIARQQAADLNQILKTLPNVEFSGSVTPLSGQPAIRGLYGERVHISVDNVKRKIDSDGSQNIAQINSLGINPDQLKQIQVLRGADSLTVGSGAIGGSIRLVTKSAADYLQDNQGLGASVSVTHLSVADANDVNVSIFHLNDHSDTVLSFGQVKYSDIDVVADEHTDKEDDIQRISKIKNESKRQNVALKNTWYINDHHSLTSKVDYSKTESIDQPYAQRMDLAIAYPTLAEDYKNDYLEGMVNYTYQADNDLIDLDVQAFFSRKTYDEITKGFIERGSNKINYDSAKTGESKRHGLRVANLSTFTGKVKHKLAIEAQYEAESFDQQQWDDNPTNLSTYYGDSDASNWSISIIDQSQWWQEKLLLTGGVRFDHYSRSSDHFTGYQDNDDSALSGELGVTIKAAEHLNLYAKTAQAFRAPSLQELYKKDEWRCHIGGKICFSEPQPDLQAEESQNYEIGFGLNWQNLHYAENLSIKVMYFDTEVDNYIDNVPFMYYIDANGTKQLGSPGPEPSNGIPVATHRDYSAKNIGKLFSHGVEIEAHYSFAALDMYLGYASMNMDVEGVPNFYLGTIDYQSQPYSEAPADKLTWNSNYQFNENINVGLQLLHYRAQQRLDDAMLERGFGTKTYTVYNLNAKYQGTGGLSNFSARLGVDNLTDKRYLRAPASEANDPAELGRNIKMTVRYQF
ncbi:TonB-dependent receptor [Pseudoalteromonas sp. PS5]|uniref:TonB-dependent receptor domain-containing protein n=1 Tax=Pseudoalteromonas sp. PS5 TaxID=1437473 RepID=UPI000FFEDDA0|nr:TonB-dependent receptor [Pseudoalteromonas sp. PS5]RXF00721.1 TonB-dependent receptor [Pseudoalteromonas sp. PS5]